jgi:hypothetical protein
VYYQCIGVCVGVFFFFANRMDVLELDWCSSPVSLAHCVLPDRYHYQVCLHVVWLAIFLFLSSSFVYACLSTCVFPFPLACAAFLIFVACLVPSSFPCPADLHASCPSCGKLNLFPSPQMPCIECYVCSKAIVNPSLPPKVVRRRVPPPSSSGTLSGSGGMGASGSTRRGVGGSLGRAGGTAVSSVRVVGAPATATTGNPNISLPVLVKHTTGEDAEALAFEATAVGGAGGAPGSGVNMSLTSSGAILPSSPSSSSEYHHYHQQQRAHASSPATTSGFAAGIVPGALGGGGGGGGGGTSASSGEYGLVVGRPPQRNPSSSSALMSPRSGKLKLKQVTKKMTKLRIGGKKKNRAAPSSNQAAVGAGNPKVSAPMRVRHTGTGSDGPVSEASSVLSGGNPSVSAPVKTIHRTADRPVVADSYLGGNPNISAPLFVRHTATGGDSDDEQEQEEGHTQHAANTAQTARSGEEGSDGGRGAAAAGGSAQPISSSRDTTEEEDEDEDEIAGQCVKCEEWNVFPPEAPLIACYNCNTPVARPPPTPRASSSSAAATPVPATKAQAALVLSPRQPGQSTQQKPVLPAKRINRAKPPPPNRPKPPPPNRPKPPVPRKKLPKPTMKAMSKPPGSSSRPAPPRPTASSASSTSSHTATLATAVVPRPRSASGGASAAAGGTAPSRTAASAKAAAVASSSARATATVHCMKCGRGNEVLTAADSHPPPECTTCGSVLPRPVANANAAAKPTSSKTSDDAVQKVGDAVAPPPSDTATEDEPEGPCEALIQALSAGEPEFASQLMKQREQRKNKKGSRLQLQGGAEKKDGEAEVEVRADADVDRVVESLANTKPQVAVVADPTAVPPTEEEELETTCRQCGSVNAFPFGVRLVACYQCQGEVSLDDRADTDDAEQGVLLDEDRLATCHACGNDNLFPRGVDLVACHHCEQPVILRPSGGGAAGRNSSADTAGSDAGAQQSSFSHTLEPAADDEDHEGLAMHVPMDDDRFATYEMERRSGGGGGAFDLEEEVVVERENDTELYREHMVEVEVCQDREILLEQQESDCNRREENGQVGREEGGHEKEGGNGEDDEEDDDEAVFECPECQAPNVFPPGANAVLCWSCREAISMTYYA